ncbi:MAG: hypothetical protein K2X08_00355 [Chlamydiales bacterium]|nr:hypothetical protein [Chlamydiales bacterium]
MPTITKNTSFFKAQILARAGFVIVALAAIVNRTVQAIFSFLAVPLVLAIMPFVSRETSRDCNSNTGKLLEWPKVIGDLFICATGFFNPAQGKFLECRRYHEIHSPMELAKELD